eukprot:864629-Prymnesium_polylepis.2
MSLVAKRSISWGDAKKQISFSYHKLWGQLSFTLGAALKEMKPTGQHLCIWEDNQQWNRSHGSSTRRMWRLEPASRWSEPGL